MTEATSLSRWGKAIRPRGEVIAGMRTAMGLTQQGLADLMTKGGRRVNRVSINRWEKGVFAASDRDLDLIAAMYSAALAKEVIGLKRAALRADGIPTDTPEFQDFVKLVEHRVWFITQAAIHRGLTVMRASFWCLLLNVELHVLSEVPAEEPTPGRSLLTREPWEVESPSETPPGDDHRPLQGFLVAAALEGSSRGVPFTQVLQEYAPQWEEAGIGWAQRLDFELRERLRWLRIYASKPDLSAFQKTEVQQREALTRELRDKRRNTRKGDHA